MRRRKFLGLFGGVAAWPLAARAQQDARIRRVGFLFPLGENDRESQRITTTIRQEFQKLGWTEGRNIRTEFRWGGGDVDRIRGYEAELVRLMPDAILTIGTRPLQILAQETRIVPIVGAQVGDLVALGIVSSLAMPGGNVTGFLEFEFKIGEKWLEVLKEVAPSIDRVMVLSNPENPISKVHTRSIENVKSAFGVELTQAEFRSAADIERATDQFAREPNGGVIVVPDVITFVNRDRVIELMARNRLPAVYAFRYYATSGGLISFGADLNDLVQRAVGYVDRILKGAKPADLPVQVPTKFDLVVNLKTAKALGITVPLNLQQRADEVIE